MHNFPECKHPVGAADKKRSFLRAERLAMEGETGVNRSQRSRAREGMHNFPECNHPVGAADKKRSFLTTERLAMDGTYAADQPCFAEYKNVGPAQRESPSWGARYGGRARQDAEPEAYREVFTASAVPRTPGR